MLHKLRICRLAALAAVAFAGCGGSVAPPKGAGADGGSAVCAGAQFGTALFIATEKMLASGQGFDLDGDGKPDNALGITAALTSPILQNGIDDGSVITLLDIDHLPPPPLADGAAGISSAVYPGIDSAMPPQPQANERGGGKFRVESDFLDAQCRPVAAITSDTVSGGSLHGAADSLLLRNGLGDTTLERFHATLTPNADFSLWTWQNGGAIPVCSLDKAMVPGLGGSALGLIVNTYAAQPDIDLDGDGLEKIVGDGKTGVKQCVDGDGTVIPGATCPCDPRMHDGYSAAFGGTMVPATIVGVAATPSGG